MKTTRLFRNLAIAAMPAILLGGCSEYLSREDRLYMGAGDTMAANKAIHVVDPWPRDSFDTRHRTGGQRFVAPIQRIGNSNTSGGGGAPSAPSSPSGGGGTTAVASAGGAGSTGSN